jgi:hypothetical protein
MPAKQISPLASASPVFPAGENEYAGDDYKETAM